ncbi:MAG: hypothetical protein ACLUNQ_01695 [Oscillospiraceae bacterium]
MGGFFGCYAVLVHSGVMGNAQTMNLLELVGSTCCGGSCRTCCCIWRAGAVRAGHHADGAAAPLVRGGICTYLLRRHGGSGGGCWLFLPPDAERGGALCIPSSSP